MADTASAPTYSAATIAFTLLLYCISGTLLTLVNKLAILSFPYANLLLVLQNGVTVILLLLGSVSFHSVFQTMPKIDREIFMTWSPLVVLFVLMLLSSLNALSYVSAVTLIVMRNLSTICVACFELVWLKEEVKTVTWFALMGILVGAVLFGARDMTFSPEGYVWLAVNVLSTSTYQVYVKKLIKESKELGPFGMSYINNMLSLPVFVTMGLGSKEIPDHLFDLFTKTSSESQAILLLSALLGFSLSTTAFMVNKMITATSMMVANNVNKFAVIILSEMFVERTLDDVSTLGTVLVMFFGWFYSKTKQLGNDALPGWSHVEAILRKLTGRGGGGELASPPRGAASKVSSNGKVDDEESMILEKDASSSSSKNTVE